MSTHTYCTYIPCTCRHAYIQMYTGGRTPNKKTTSHDIEFHRTTSNTYIHTYILTYLHTYIHTYIHTHIQRYQTRRTGRETTSQTDRQTGRHTSVQTYVQTCVQTDRYWVHGLSRIRLCLVASIECPVGILLKRVNSHPRTCL